MAYRFRGKTQDGTTVGARLGNATNFMVAIATVQELLKQKMKEKAGTIVSFSLRLEGTEDSFKIREKKPKQK